MLREKPIATTIEEADKLVRLSEERDLTLQIGHSERFNTAVEKLRERIQDEISQDIQRRAMEGDSEAIEMIEEYMRGQGVGKD